jgi:hypothetical protein
MDYLTIYFHYFNSQNSYEAESKTLSRLGGKATIPSVSGTNSSAVSTYISSLLESLIYITNIYNILRKA